MTDKPTNGHPVDVPAMLGESAQAQAPTSALAMLAPAARAEVEAMSRNVLAENFARSQIAIMQLRHETTLALMAVARLLARAHRGLVDGQGRAVELGATIMFAQSAALLPPEMQVLITPLGAPPTGPGQPPQLHGVEVRVVAPEARKPEAGIVGADGKAVPS